MRGNMRVIKWSDMTAAICSRRPMMLRLVYPLSLSLLFVPNLVSAQTFSGCSSGSIRTCASIAVEAIFLGDRWAVTARVTNTSFESIGLPWAAIQNVGFNGVTSATFLPGTASATIGGVDVTDLFLLDVNISRLAFIGGADDPGPFNAIFDSRCQSDPQCLADQQTFMPVQTALYGTVVFSFEVTAFPSDLRTQIGVLNGKTVDQRVSCCSNADLTRETPPTTVVPEPITMVLLGSGLFGIGAARLRRRKRGEDI